MDFDAKLCTIWQSRLLRWSLLSICWPTYILYRSLVIGQIKYDPDSGTMNTQPRNILMYRIALLLKTFVFVLDYFGLKYLAMAFYPTFPRSRQYQYQKRQFLGNLVEAVACQISIWNICLLCYWLQSLSWNRSFVRFFNEVIHVVSLVGQSLGPLPLEEEGIALLIIYVVQLELTLLQLYNYIRGRLYIFVLNGILIEMFYNTYIAYLFLLLSWLTLINRFFKNHYKMGSATRQQRQKILKLLHLYSRINNGHQDIVVQWLPMASVLFSGIVMMVCHAAAIIYIVLFSHDLDPVGKWNWVAKDHLGGGLAPFLRILLIGLCNDRLAQLERYLSLQLLFTDLRHSGWGEAEKSFVRKLTNLKTCFDIQLRAQPIRNPIIGKYQACGSPFVLEFLFCVLLNAFSYVQYGISNNSPLYNFQQTNYLFESEKIYNTSLVL